LVEGIVFACTSASTYNTALGYNALTAPTVGVGIANVAVGFAAGTAVTDGYGNTMVGPASGCAVTTGTVNTAVGIGSLSGATSGFANIGIGICSGCAYTTESGNAVFGGYYGDPGDTNAVILSDGASNIKAKFNGVGALSFDGTTYGTAGQVLTSNGAAAKPSWQAGSVVSNATPTTSGLVFGYVGSDLKSDSSVSLGLNALLSASPLAPSNAAVGARALESLASGGGNVAMGFLALQAVTAGGSNTAIGYQAGAFAVGDGNTLIGGDSGTSVVGNNNSFFGNGSGQGQATGDSNLALGYNVELANPNGSCQLAIGFSTTDNWLTGDSTKAIKPGAGIIDCAGSCGTAGQALLSDGANAVCWGSSSGASTATPTVTGLVYGFVSGSSVKDQNVGLGYNTLVSKTAGAGNTAIGSCALGLLVSASGNVAVGAGALKNTTNGATNTAIGYNVGGSVQGSGNVLVGQLTGAALALGNSNTFVGNGAAANQTDGCFNVAIGPGVCLANSTGSCQLVIGFSGTDNWLTGDSTKAIQPGAGIIDCANVCGTANQVLVSTGANAVQWKPVNSALAVPNYGAFYTATTQTLATVNTPQPIQFLTLDSANNFSVVSNTQVTAAAAGVYNVQFSLQLLATPGGGGDYEVWPAINGTPIPNSNTRFSVKNTNEAECAALNYIITLAAGQYIELYWATDDTSNLLYGNASLYGGPNVPSAIITVVPVGA
jgi:hypothetical protein